MSAAAVAGGFGDLGRVFVTSLVAARKPAYILTRKIANDSAAERGATPLEVDYSNVPMLAEVLAARNIGTVISALNMDSQNASDAQINLIQAASASGSVTRFIPSDFNVDYDVSDELFPYPEKSFHQQAKAELQKHPGLTCTSIQAGMFMDYYGIPRLKTHLRALVAFVDVEHRKAAIPGDGNAKVAFTLTEDLAEFVVALLDLPVEKWPRSAMVVGDRLTLNELVEMLEKIVGNKFDVEYESVAKLRKGVPAELPGNIPHYGGFPGGKAQVDLLQCHLGMACANGVYDVQARSLNDVFPQLSPQTMEGFLKAHWTNKEA